MLIFGEATERIGRDYSVGGSVPLIQHVLELSLGITLKSNELDPEPITLFPSDDGEGYDNRRPRSGRFKLETKTRADGKVDMAINLPTGYCEIF